MTVKDINGDQVDCFWTDVNGQINADSFPLTCSRWDNGTCRDATDAFSSEVNVIPRMYCYELSQRALQ